ncbi:MAG TPA: hypothetical protein VF773_10470 [Verrucomicrobiae bacterium]
MLQPELSVGFLIPSAYENTSSIWRKALMQAAELRKLGARAKIFSFSGKGTDQLPDHVHLPLNGGGWFAKERQLAALIDKMRVEGITAAYLRRELWHPCYRKLMSSIATVAEVNSDERAEFKLTMSLPRRVYATLTAGHWRKFPSGYACVTNDLTACIPKDKEFAVISNGILNAVQVPPASTEKPHIVFSATGEYAWHGKDKFVAMARLFPEWDFSFIGDLSDELRQQTPANLKIHGRLPAAEADRLLLSGNIGVGTLAFHRMGMKEASILKVRSYMAAGLPTIIAYKDTDFSNGFDFICEISNTEDNIVRDKEKIRSFVLANYKRRIPWEQVKFASESEKARLRYDLLQRAVVWKKNGR